MVQALGYSLTPFDARSPGRLCRGRERWLETLPLDEPAPMARLVVSGATFSDDTARDARRGLPFAGVGFGELLEALFPGVVLLAFAEQGEPPDVPAGTILAEAYAQPRFGGRRMDACVRWRATVAGAAAVDPLCAGEIPAADGFLPWTGEHPEALERALFLLTGHGERLGLPARRFQPSALPDILAHVPWVALVHMDKHAPALGIYAREPLEVVPVLQGLAARHGALAVPFSIPPMLARWDRALYELRLGWDQRNEFPVPPGDDTVQATREAAREE